MPIGPLVQCVGLLLGGVCVDNDFIDEWARCRRDCVASCRVRALNDVQQHRHLRHGSQVFSPPPPLSLSLSLSLISSSRILPSSSPFYACCCCWWWWCTGRLGKDEWLIAITIAHSACAIVVVIWYNSCIAPPSLVFAITYIHVRTPQYLCLSLMLNFTWIKLQTYSWRSRTCRRGHRVMQLNYKAERL